jgi:hypothetical protein
VCRNVCVYKPWPCVMPMDEALKSKMKSWSLVMRARRLTAVPASSSCCWKVRPLESRIGVFEGTPSVPAVREAMKTRREAGRYMVASSQGRVESREVRKLS